MVRLAYTSAARGFEENAMTSGPEFWIVIAVIVLFFGSSQLPKLARSIGEASSEFKKSVKEGADENDAKDE
jgi:sec-independent protein translocase protein TatA